jgi:hypothetical protein
MSAFSALRQLPAARTIGASVLAALIGPALLQGNIQVAIQLALFPGLQQSAAACVQQLLQLSVRLPDQFSRSLTKHLLQLPGAHAMVSMMNDEHDELITCRLCWQEGYGKKDTATFGCLLPVAINPSRTARVSMS